MTVRQLPIPKFRIEKSDGSPASGWKVYTYEPGTTTAKATYTTAAGDVANANPVILNSRGEADIWWDGLYKVVVKDNNDVTIYTVDNHGSGLTPLTSSQLSLVPNYSFEDATENVNTPDNWTITLYTDGAQTLDTSAGNQIHGSKSLKFTSAGTGGGFAESELFLVQEAVPVAITVPIKSSTAGVRNLIEIVWYDRSEVLVSTTSLYDNSTTNPTSWTDQTFSATPPSNARFALIRLTGCHSSDSTTGSTWFDNVVVDSGLVKLTATQTLTNKTLTSPVLSGTATGSGTVGGSIVVPLARLQRNEASGENSGVVTVTSSDTTVVDLDVGTVTSGDRIFVQGTILSTKGGTGGLVEIEIVKASGTATISATHNQTGLFDQNEWTALSIPQKLLSGIIKVTGSGTLTLRLQCASEGSDTIIGPGNGELYALVLNNG